MNDYLNLETDDMEITNIIKQYKKQIQPTMSFGEFKKVITELDNIQNDELSEYDEGLICKILENLNKKMNKHIKHFLKDKSSLNSGQTFGELMNFILKTGY